VLSEKHRDKGNIKVKSSAALTENHEKANYDNYELYTYNI